MNNAIGCRYIRQQSDPSKTMLLVSNHQKKRWEFLCIAFTLSEWSFRDKVSLNFSFNPMPHVIFLL